LEQAPLHGRSLRHCCSRVRHFNPENSAITCSWALGKRELERDMSLRNIARHRQNSRVSLIGEQSGASDRSTLRWLQPVLNREGQVIASGKSLRRKCLLRSPRRTGELHRSRRGTDGASAIRHALRFFGRTRDYRPERADATIRVARTSGTEHQFALLTVCIRQQKLSGS